MRTLPLALICLSLAISPSIADPQQNSLAGDQQTFDRGAEEYDAGHYENAYKIFSYLADHNDIAAMRNVALMKRKGIGCDRDPEGARDYFEQAAKGGLATAAADLADMLLNGEGGPPDAKAAVHWLKLAAAARHPRAEFELGQMYETGNVIPKDIQTAESLYEDAAAAGMKGAYARLTAVRAMLAQRSETGPEKNGPAPAAGDTKVASAPDSRTAAVMPPETKTSVAGDFVLQIGAYKSEAVAMESWRAYKTAHAAVAEFEPDIKRADLPGKGTWYRLRIGSFASAADANALCSKLKTSGGDCFPARR